MSEIFVMYVYTHKTLSGELSTTPILFRLLKGVAACYSPEIALGAGYL